MIIGIAGKKQSGKDTIGKIIQYLSFLKHNPDISWEDYWLKKPGGYTGDYQIKKFADKIKDIVCLLIGCTREQLEDETFKNTELGEEWNKYELFTHEVDTDTYLSFSKDKQKAYDKVKMTPRLLLQLIGTECGREILHPNIWVNSLMSEYDNIINTMKAKMRRKGFSLASTFIGFPNWIITDVRFPNEVEAIRKRGGIVIKVERSSVLRTDKLFESAEHFSEIALDNFDNWDYVINNNVSMEELIEQVDEIVKKII